MGVLELGAEVIDDDIVAVGRVAVAVGVLVDVQVAGQQPVAIAVQDRQVVGSPSQFVP